MKTLRLLLSASALFVSAAAVQADDRMYVAHLYGGNERPVLGDLDSYGIATVTINAAGTGVCYSIVLHNTVANTVAHIHAGAPHIAGGITLNLPINAGVPLRVANCVAAPAGVINGLRSGSQNFYVNVHNAAFPGGAARGQLQ